MFNYINSSDKEKYNYNQPIYQCTCLHQYNSTMNSIKFSSICSETDDSLEIESIYCEGTWSLKTIYNHFEYKIEGNTFA